jgi:hypothetical protein
MYCKKKWEDGLPHVIIRVDGEDKPDMVHTCRLTRNHEGRCLCNCML